MTSDMVIVRVSCKVVVERIVEGTVFVDKIFDRTVLNSVYVNVAVVVVGTVREPTLQYKVSFYQCRKGIFA
jgi:hypothetical protein